MKMISQKFKTLLLSILIHACFMIALIWNVQPPSQTPSHNALWQGSDVAVITLNLKANNGNEPSVEDTAVQLEKQNALNSNKHLLKSAATTQTQNVETNDSLDSGTASGAGMDDSGPLSPSTLAQIRKKIAKNKVYPMDSESQPLAGLVKLGFQITPDGKIVALTILTSSGSQTIDNAALKSIKRAEPLPYYKNPIAIELEYQ